MEFQEIITIILGSSLLASIFGSLILELYKTRSRRIQRKHTQMEERFFSLLTTLISFAEQYEKPEEKDEFLNAYRQIWLYAPDKVILAINTFFKSVVVREIESEPNRRAGEMVLELRKAYYGNTNLRSSDFMIVTRTNKK